MAQEGQIARGPNGERAIFTGGQWVVMPAEQGAITMAPPAAQQYEAPKAAAQVRNEVVDARVNEATLPAQIRSANAKADADEIAAEKARAELRRGPQLTDAGRLAAVQAYNDANTLFQIAQDLRTKFAAGPGSTEGIYGVQDYFPSTENKRFDDAGQRARGFVKRALGFTSGEGNTLKESNSLYEPYLPTAGDRDQQILDKIAALEGLARQAASQSSQLTGAPMPEWTNPQAQQQPQDGPNAMTAIRMGSNAPVQAQETGAVGTQTVRNPDDIPPAMEQEMNDIVARLLSEGGGRIDPQRYAQEANAMTQKYGFGVSDPAAWATRINEYLDAGGTTIPSGVIPAERIMTATETMGNNLANNPIGGLFAGAANGLSAGLLEAGLPGEMMAMRDAQPLATLGGEIGGAIGITALGGAGAGTIAGRLAPRLMQGGARGQFARNVATDATYGAAYGQNTQGDAAMGAAIGSLGSVGGQALGRGLGSAIGGVQRSAAAEALRNRGVPISVARQVGLGRAEDAMQSIPIVGDMSRARQLDSFNGFNEAAMRQAGEPIGFNPTQVGAAGVDDFGNAVSDAYSNATRGVMAPVDGQTAADLAAVRQTIAGLPEDYRAAAETILDRRVGPAMANGQITGEQFQQAIRGIKQARSNAGRNPSLAGFEQEFRDSLTGVEDLLTSTMTRGAGPEVAANLNAANAANRGFKTVEDASLNRANVGTQAGEPNIFTPAQLLASARAAERKGFGDNPLMELGRQGQEVLPSTLPNSGTTDRAIMAGIAGSAGLGAGGGASVGGVDGAQSGALGGGALALALAALGTRGGQQALEKILISRPQGAQALGQGIRRRGGLFGSAGGSMALQGY